MGFDPRHVIQYLWLALGLVWLLGAFAVKRTARRQSVAGRLLQLLLGAAALLIGFSRYFEYGLLSCPFLHDSPVVALSGLVLAGIGIGFAIWARLTLGGNWSGTATLKEDHSLIKTGPYRIVRHPIYTGILIGLAGTIVVFHQVRGLVAFGLVLVMLLEKIRVEEQFMVQQFDDEYVEYSRKVRALVPFVY